MSWNYSVVGHFDCGGSGPVWKPFKHAWSGDPHQQRKEKVCPSSANFTSQTLSLRSLALLPLKTSGNAAAPLNQIVPYPIYGAGRRWHSCALSEGLSGPTKVDFIYLIRLQQRLEVHKGRYFAADRLAEADLRTTKELRPTSQA
jgi:hypothetical protein